MSGGKREGAGRPPIDPRLVKVPVGYKLPRWLVDWLRDQDEPAAQLIEDALRRRHKLKPPEPEADKLPAVGTPVERPVGRPVPERDDCLPASLAGRCANGYERGQGPRVHAVPRSDELERNGYCLTRALCGAKPGPRSAGWSYYGPRAVTCPRCAAKTPNARYTAPHNTAP